MLVPRKAADPGQWSFPARFLTLLLFALLACGRPSESGTGSEDPPALLSTVATAAGPRRAIEPRLSGGFGYAPCEAPAEDGVCQAAKLGPDAHLVAVAAEVRRHTRGSRTPERLHVDAVLDLLGSQTPATLERSLLHLEAAVALKSDDARLWNDLAALYLVQGGMHRSGWSSVRALESIGTAEALQPGSPVVLFNRALLLEKMHLVRSAAAAWSLYLAADPDSPWATEARRHLEGLQRPSRQELWQAESAALKKAALRGDLAAVIERVREFPAAAHFQVRDELLARWAEAVETDPSQAGEALTLARTLAEALREVAGDPLLSEAVAAIDATGTQLAEAHRQYGRGQEAYTRHDYQAARGPFERAAQGFTRAGSPFYAWASFFAAICDLQGDNDAGMESLAKLRAQVAADRYPIVAGRIEWVLGIGFGRRNEFTEALKCYRTSLAALQGSLGNGYAAFVHVLISEALDFLGHREASWTARQEALRDLSWSGDSARLHTALIICARSLLRLGLPRSAMFFLDEAVANAEDWGDTYARAYSRLQRGRNWSQLGDGEAALRDFREAQLVAEGLDDPDFRARVLDDLRLEEAAARLRTSPPAALDQLVEVRRRYQQQDQSALLPRVLGLEAEAHLELGQVDEAEEALDQAVRLFEDLLSAEEAAPEPRLVTGAEEAFRRMITVKLDLRQNAAAALAYAERSRALPPYRATEAERAAMRRSLELPPLAADTVVLFFQDLDERVLVWRLTAGGQDTFTIPLSPQRLRERSLEVVVGFSQGTGGQDLQDSLADLYDLVLREPLEAMEMRTLVVVPDRSVTAIPFPALYDRRRSGFLVEEAGVLVAPSLTVLGRRSGRARSSSGLAGASILAIGEPRPSSPAAGALEPLPVAAEEARRVAAFYPESTVLVGEEATRARFLELAGRYDILHYAGHSTIDPFNPHRSFLHLTASANRDDGDLSSAEIHHLGLSSTRLVVLSSCSSTLDRSMRKRAPFGLGGDFLAAGAPAVIGALWPVDDAPTIEFMSELHRFLSTGLASVDALRETQLLALHSGNPELATVQTWGAFRLLGALEGNLEGSGPVR